MSDENAYARLTFDASQHAESTRQQLAKHLCSFFDDYFPGGDFPQPEADDCFEWGRWIAEGLCTIDGYVRFGEFYDVTEWLKEHKIPFDRFRQPLDMGRPELLYSRPGWRTPEIITPAMLTDGGQVLEVVTRAEVRILYDEGNVRGSMIALRGQIFALSATRCPQLAVVKYEPLPDEDEEEAADGP